MNNNDTIFALSSGHGKSGVAVIRISGDNLRDLFARLLGRNNFEPRRAYFANIRDNAGDLIDQAILLFFAAPNSFTGTDVIEIHSHGAPAVINKIFEFLGDAGARMATRGEFSRRAFYNGKMDLADVDGLAALLDAQTERQRRAALQSMTGRDSRIYDAWRSQMIEIAAYAAAILDYADDELPTNIGDKIREKTQILYTEIDNAISRYAASRAIRSGFNIALAGNTNAGKSSLFNRLVGENRAIVSDIPGTTRDVVSCALDIDGYMVNIADTAGLRDTDDTIEQIGIQRTNDEIKNADLVLHVIDGGQSAEFKVQSSNNEITVVNKSDLCDCKNKNDAIYVSAKTGDGIDNLMIAIRRRITELVGTSESQLTVNARTRALLTDARTELRNAITAGDNYDIFAEHVRRAADAIGKILGTITAADVMDATFSQLCLGK